MWFPRILSLNFWHAHSLEPMSQNDLDLEYSHQFNKLTVSTNFQVTSYKTLWKIQCSHFFPLKSLCGQIWPCHKLGQGQPKVMIYVNYDGLESLMLHFKFHWYRTTGSEEEDFSRFVLFITLAAILVTLIIYIDFHPKEAPHKIWFW